MLLLLLNPRRTRTNMKLLQLVWIFLLTLCGQSGITAMRFILYKHVSPKPEIDASPQPDGVLLKCEVKGAYPEPIVEWWDRDGNVLPADEPQVKPQSEYKYDVILTITVTKAGFYRCVSTQKKINRQVYTETFTYGPGGASKPDAKEINETKDGVLLQCIVQDPSPQAKVSWKDSAGQDVPSKELKTENSIILWTTVTKTDDYRCVTTEGKKDDEVYDEIRVKVIVSDGASNGLIIGLILGFAIEALVVGTIGVFLWCRYKKRAGGSTTDGSKKNGYDLAEQTCDD